jgi:hypothetical protein
VRYEIRLLCFARNGRGRLITGPSHADLLPPASTNVRRPDAGVGVCVGILLDFDVERRIQKAGSIQPALWGGAHSQQLLCGILREWINPSYETDVPLHSAKYWIRRSRTSESSIHHNCAPANTAVCVAAAQQTASEETAFSINLTTAKLHDTLKLPTT